MVGVLFASPPSGPSPKDWMARSRERLQASTCPARMCILCAISLYASVHLCIFFGDEKFGLAAVSFGKGSASGFWWVSVLTGVHARQIWKCKQQNYARIISLILRHNIRGSIHSICHTSMRE